MVKSFFIVTQEDMQISSRRFPGRLSTFAETGINHSLSRAVSEPPDMDPHYALKRFSCHHTHRTSLQLTRSIDNTKKPPTMMI